MKMKCAEFFHVFIHSLSNDEKYRNYAFRLSLLPTVHLMRLNSLQAKLNQNCI